MLRSPAAGGGLPTSSVMYHNGHFRSKRKVCVNFKHPVYREMEIRQDLKCDELLVSGTQVCLAVYIRLLTDCMLVPWTFLHLTDGRNTSCLALEKPDSKSGSSCSLPNMGLKPFSTRLRLLLLAFSAKPHACLADAPSDPQIALHLSGAPSLAILPSQPRLQMHYSRLKTSSLMIPLSVA